ncbi:hypothetical protein Hanom_Chr12g01075421 [Helianthus anomalus]
MTGFSVDGFVSMADCDPWLSSLFFGGSTPSLTTDGSVFVGDSFLSLST